MGNTFFKVHKVSINLLDQDKYDFKSMRVQRKDMPKRRRGQPAPAVPTKMWDVYFRDPVGAALFLTLRKDVVGELSFTRFDAL